MNLKYTLLFSFFVALCLSLLSIDSIEKFSLNLHFKIRGKRPLSQSLINITLYEDEYYKYLSKKNSLNLSSPTAHNKTLPAFPSKTQNYFFWNTEFYIKLLTKIKKFDPLLVVIIPTFPATDENSICFNKLSAIEQNTLLSLSQSIPVLWSSTLNADNTLTSPPEFLYNTNIFHNNIFPDADLCVRRAFLKKGDSLSLVGAVWSHVKVKEHFTNSTFNKIDESFFINFSAAKTTKYHLSATTFIDSIDSGWKNVFKDKIVLIDIESTFSNKHLLPYRHDEQNKLATNREIQNEILNSLIENITLKKTPFWITFIISFTLSILATLPFLFCSLLFSQVLISSMILTFIIISIIFFGVFFIWINTITPLITIFATTLIMTIGKYVSDDRTKLKKIHEEIDTLKSNFLSLISHNLKTPIAKIRALSSVLLKKDSNNLSEEQKEALLNILRSSRDLTSYISNILNITRIESQKIKLNKSVCDINVIIHQVTDRVRTLLDNKPIKFNLQLEPIFSVEIDKDLFFQLFFNVLENAVKYSPNNSTVTIKSKEVGNYVEISVKDQGIGISKEEINRIFNKFHRTQNIYTESITGTGLGLYLAKFFVELHNGEINVDSSLGEGATFTISLPIS